MVFQKGQFWTRDRRQVDVRGGLVGVDDCVLEGGVVLGGMAVNEEEAVVVVCVVGKEEVEGFGECV